MEDFKIEHQKSDFHKSLIEKISSIEIFKSISSFLNNKKNYIIPLFISTSEPEFIIKLENKSKEILNDIIIIDKIYKNEIKKIISLTKFFCNCKTVYKEEMKNFDIIKIKDPISDIFNKIEKNGPDIILNYNKYFYYFLMNVPFINLSPFCSLMNVIFFNEYYKGKKSPKIINLILYLNEEVSKSRINDLFGEIIFNPNNYIIKRKSIDFNCDLFMKAISGLYEKFNEPIRFIVNGENKNIKHNFKNKTEFIIDNILFKLKFKYDSLLIINRV